MEEVDQIITHTLRQLGCDIEDDVESLREFTTELVVEGVVRCLQLIQPDSDLPRHVPPSMAARYRLGAALAAACVAEGFSGEIGYQTFLYSSETELRKIFLFLIEKLPKESEKLVSEPLGKSALVKRSIAIELSKRLSFPWTPSYCKEKGIRWSSPTSWHKEGFKHNYPVTTSPVSFPNYGGNNLGVDLPTDVTKYYDTHMKYVTDQIQDPENLVPSLLESNTTAYAVANEWENEWNEIGLGTRLSEQDYKQKKREKMLKQMRESFRQTLKNCPALETSVPVTVTPEKVTRIKGSLFTHTEKLQFTKEEERGKKEEVTRLTSTEDLVKQREEEVKTLQAHSEEINSKLQSLELQSKQLSAGIQQINEQMGSQARKAKELEESYLVRKQTFDLLPDADNNLLKLQSVVDITSQRLVSLANQWEKHRAPLIEQYRQLKELNSQQLDESQRKLEEIKMLREKMKEISQEAHNKDDLHKQLISDYEKLKKDFSRSAYTRRIIEIVGNIKKQKAEIEKVLIDTKSVQKEINTLSGKLDRTFTVTDELIFKDAKKDEASRRAYKHLAALHENCSLLIQTVEETGAIMREIRDLEDQIEVESQKKVAGNLERITADLKQMKQENGSLLTQLQSQQS